MIASRVLPEAELKEILGAEGWEETPEKTKTGTFWSHQESGKYLLVPLSEQGFYPSWMLTNIEEMLGRVGPAF